MKLSDAHTGEITQYVDKVIDLQEGCRVGRGNTVRDIREVDPQLASIISTKTNLINSLGEQSTVLLTPTTTTHPIFQGESTYSRGIRHHRSFSRLFNPSYSLVVKGGDVLNHSDIKKEVNRIRKKQIPGSGELTENKREFDAAVTLQRLAIEQLGRPTYTAYPFQIRIIEQVPTDSGKIVDIKTFLNSQEYIEERSFHSTGRKYLGLSDMDDVGDLLIDKHNLIPSEYLYGIEGLDIRVNELASLVCFDDSWESHKNDLLFMLAEGSGLGTYGTFLEKQGKSKNEIIQGVYAVLGAAYDFDPKDILPSYDLDRNYIQAVLNDIPNAFDTTGIGSKVLGRFIDRITEVAALAHGAGLTFSEKETGGSLIPRNVTYNGIVLDLDTIRPIGLDEMDMVIKDFDELILTIACMRRLVSNTCPPDFLETIKTTYANKLSVFCQDENRKNAILAAIQDIREDTLEMLMFSRI